MEIFKLLESTISIPTQLDAKDLRRDELIDIYDKANRTLQTLIKAKQNEIAYRRDLLSLLDKSKTAFDNKLTDAKQKYSALKKNSAKVPNSNESSNKSDRKSNNNPLPMNPPQTSTASTTTHSTAPKDHHKSSDLDIPPPTETTENRSSLDRRLSEFLKTFPNLTQAGLAPPSNDTKPLPGYYTQQPPPPPALAAGAPPLIAMMRFPPPPMMQPSMNLPPLGQENHDVADMDLSDYEESNNNGSGIIPMVASAMQQGAGGKHGVRSDPAFASGQQQQYNNAVPYTPRLSALPFDPSIMDSRLRDSPSSSGSRDRHSHSERGSHRHSSSSGSSTGGSRQGSSKSKQISPSSSGRNKRRLT